MPDLLKAVSKQKSVSEKGHDRHSRTANQFGVKFKVSPVSKYTPWYGHGHGHVW